MERVKPLIVTVLLATVGCTTTPKTAPTAAPQSTWEQIQHKAEKVVGIEQPVVPATEFTCAWQNRLQQLPDPGRNGQMTTGIAGQIFLYTEQFAPAEINGDLVLMVSDATPRPNNVPGKTNEVWHFTKETLKKMAMTDERFGRSFIIFLPWPDSWRDVNRLSIQARYDQATGNTLYAQPMTLTLDTANATAPTATAGGGFNAVPDPKMVAQRMKEVPPGSTNTIQQAGVWSPPPQFDTKDPIFAPPPPNMAPVGQWAPPQQDIAKPSSPAEFKRMVIPRK
ncbi:hypothetical protein BH11PLA2_BH11PLA2_25860 [soil metagenome]